MLKCNDKIIFKEVSYMSIEVPKHIAIIMDGNGRWAKKRGLPRTLGHREGARTLQKILKYAGEIGIQYLTVYAFSTENWSRSEEEVSALMKLFSKYMKKEEKNLIKNNVRFLVSGRKDRVSDSLLREIKALEEKTSQNIGITFHIAFNYGGRAEIVDAVNRLLQEKKESISEEDISSHLYQNLPDPELIIRTSGEFRISNFLLWQLAYAEIYVTDTLWPDFEERDLELALKNFQKRERRFGGVYEK